MDCSFRVSRFYAQAVANDIVVVFYSLQCFTMKTIEKPSVYRQSIKASTSLGSRFKSVRLLDRDRFASLACARFATNSLSFFLSLKFQWRFSNKCKPKH